MPSIQLDNLPNLPPIEPLASPSPAPAEQAGAGKSFEDHFQQAAAGPAATEDPVGGNASTEANDTNDEIEQTPLDSNQQSSRESDKETETDTETDDSEPVSDSVDVTDANTQNSSPQTSDEVKLQVVLAQIENAEVAKDPLDKAQGKNSLELTEPVVEQAGARQANTEATEGQDIFAEPIPNSLNVIPGEAGTLTPGGTIQNGSLRFVSNNGVDNALSIGLSGFQLLLSDGSVINPSLSFGSIQAAVGETAVTDFVVFDSLGSPLNVRLTAAIPGEVSVCWGFVVRQLLGQKVA